jgi:predicted nucleic acid-binding protein
MKKQRLYLETTLFNYYFDQDRDGHQATVTLFENIGKKINYGYSSDIVYLELNNAPEQKKK